jgi:hypothetical protein
MMGNWSDCENDDERMMFMHAIWPTVKGACEGISDTCGNRTDKEARLSKIIGVQAEISQWLWEKLKEAKHGNQVQLDR